jgi:hypothetical protein
MLRLTATFKVSLANPLYINRLSQQERVRTIPPLRYDTRIDDSDVEVALLEIHPAMRQGDRTIWAVPEVRVSVSRSETVDPPPIQRTAQGGRDFRDRWSYFQERDPIYRGAAIEALHRLVCFFKYKQAHVLLRDAPLADLMSNLQWTNEMWTDDTRQEFPSGSSPLRVLSLYGIELDEEVGVRGLAAADDLSLQQALAEPPIEPELYEELLSDARAALFQGSLRRAIIELAISCEVAIKQAFFNKATAAELSMYFDERKQINDDVGGFTNLLGKPAEHILGQNFRKIKRRAAAHIDGLFRCRNQIAHEGEPTYKDKRGRSQIVDQAIAKEWFKAAHYLFYWLQRMHT